MMSSTKSLVSATMALAVALVLAPGNAEAQRTKPAARGTVAPTTAVVAQPATAVVDSSEKPDEPDGAPPDPIVTRASKPSLTFVSRSAPSRPLASQANAASVAQEAAKRIDGSQVNVSLVGGEKYMINSCLGIKASAGTFAVRFDNPTVSLQGNEVVTSFKIERVEFNVLKVRFRPNTNILEPCSFSKRYEIGGVAKDVKLRVSYTPFIDPSACVITTMGSLDYRWTIDELNLKPMQNNLDAMAKNMIEDALNNFATGQLGAIIRDAVNGALQIQGC